MKKILLGIALILSIVQLAQAQEYGVYVKAVEQAQGSFDVVVKQTETAVENAGWNVLASYGAGVRDRCGKRAHNIAIYSQNYADKILQHGPDAAYLVVLRVGVYDDKDGISVAFTNPASINRTALGEGVEDAHSAATMKTLADTIAKGVPGNAVSQQIGQIRTKAKVGGMGGGDFKKKIEEIYSAEGFEDVMRNIGKNLESGGKDWRLVYTAKPADNMVIYGVTKTEDEATAFNIAGEKREKKSKKQHACPGLDHVSAFPIEVVVFERDGNGVVAMLDEMYRMKMYFEDAGNWAFMKNATMPGRMEREIKDVSTKLLVR